MEFDKLKVYTALNAEKLKVGSRCIFADTVQALCEKVESDDAQQYVHVLTDIRGDGEAERFEEDDYIAHVLAYLIEPPDEPKYKPFSNMENIKKASVKCKGFIKTKQGAQEGIIIGISFDNRVIIKKRYGLEYLTFEQLFESYTFDDGSPCGELVEE